MRLTAAQVKGIDQPGKHPIGGGLYLQVAGGGSKSWLYRYQINNRRRWMGLGGYPEVSLSKARDLRDDFKRNFIMLGVDPLTVKEQEKGRAEADRQDRAKQKMTFAICAEQYIDNNVAGWKSAKHGKQWRSTLTTYAYPFIGDTAVAAIDFNHILDILTPIWLTKTETASRVRGRVEVVLDYAKVLKHREGENPALWKGNLDKTLPKPSKVTKKKHHPALPYDGITPFMVELASAKGSAARALTFTILCAARTSETLNATWDEIDLDKKLWTIPSERMKADKEHRVPLSDNAITVLRAQEGANSTYVFPGSRTGKPMSNMSMTSLLRRMDRGDITVHGFRSTFRDWTAEKTNYVRRVAETALAHQLTDSTEASYQRGDFIEKRAALMQDWADYCYKTKSTKVVSLESKRQQQN
jgi:integrase